MEFHDFVEKYNCLDSHGKAIVDAAISTAYSQKMGAACTPRYLLARLADLPDHMRGGFEIAGLGWRETIHILERIDKEYPQYPQGVDRGGYKDTEGYKQACEIGRVNGLHESVTELAYHMAVRADGLEKFYGMPLDERAAAIWQAAYDVNNRRLIEGLGCEKEAAKQATDIADAEASAYRVEQNRLGNC